MTPPALRLNCMIFHFPYAGNGACSAESPDIREWEVETALKASKDPRVGDFWSKSLSDTPITLTRNRAIRIAKSMGAHVLVMVDSDQSPNLHRGEPWFRPFWDEAFNFIYERYQKGPHVVFAPYCGPPNGTENCYVFRPESMGNHFQETGWKLDPYTRNEAAMMTGIQEAGAGPTGMIMLDLRACDLIEPVAMSKEMVLEHLIQGKMTKEEALYALRDGYFYYEYTDQYCSEKASTEDVTFTRDIALAGLAKLGYNPIHCAWNSWVGHHKPWNVGKPKRYMMEHVNASYRKAVLDGERANERIMDLKSAVDPELARIADLAIREQVVAKSNGNGHPAILTEPAKPSKIVTNHWRAWDKAVQFATRLATRTSSALIVDVGPGQYPFHAATEYVGRKLESGDWDKPFHEIDLNQDRLPYDDQSVDFLYCRHVLEDLDNPCHLLREIQRVAKAGWIETPSPMCELTSGVDAPGSLHKGKGYGHHRNILWSSGSALHIVPKLPVLEQLSLPEHHDLLNEGAWNWNTYHVFGEKTLEFVQHQHEVDFNVNSDDRYQVMLQNACKLGIAVSRQMHELAAGEKQFKLYGNMTTKEADEGAWHEHGHAPEKHLETLQDIVRAHSHKLNRKLRILEVGTWLGTTAMALADAVDDTAVHCVDNWDGTPTDITGELVVEAGGPDKVYEEFVRRIGSRMNDSIFPWRMTSGAAAKRHWEPFDIVFIDADHTYEGCLSDIQNWWPHLRDDGIMVGHDFHVHGYAGVVQAVKECFGDKVDTCGWHPQGCMWLVRKSECPELLNEHLQTA